jgi:Na+/citrate or Na+/malate symporter
VTDDFEVVVAVVIRASVIVIVVGVVVGTSLVDIWFTVVIGIFVVTSSAINSMFFN